MVEKSLFTSTYFECELCEMLNDAPGQSNNNEASQLDVTWPDEVIVPEWYITDWGKG